MSHNAYIRGSIGAWATGTTVSSAEFWQLDQYTYGAINGDAGGTWAPATAITLGGTAGLVLGTGNPLTVGGILTAGDIDATGYCNLSGDVSLGGPTTTVTMLANDLLVWSDADFRSPTTFRNSVTITGTSGALTTASNVPVTLTGDNSLGSTPGDTGKATTITGDLISLGDGGRVAFSTLDIGDANASVGYYYRYFATPSVLRTLDVTILNPRQGTEFHVHNIGVASLYLQIGGVLTATVGASSSITVVWNDTAWRILP